jgi:hypothetical protein
MNPKQANSQYGDKVRFNGACRAICGSVPSRNGIGVLSEKTLHSVIKRFIEPNEALQEVKVGGYYADIKNEDGIFEIQTRSFNKLRTKLTAYLETEKVTVVYPIPAVKRLVWIDAQTGELTSPRKSPKRGSYFDAFPELYKLDMLIANESLCVLLLMIDMDEYRYLNGWSADGKKGSTRHERYPIALADSVLLATKEDYERLLPSDLCSSFTSKEFALAAKIRLRVAQTVLTVLSKCGAIQCVGRKGRQNLYMKATMMRG